MYCLQHYLHVSLVCMCLWQGLGEEMPIRVNYEPPPPEVIPAY